MCHTFIFSNVNSGIHSQYFLLPYSIKIKYQVLRILGLKYILNLPSTSYFCRLYLQFVFLLNFHNSLLSCDSTYSCPSEIHCPHRGSASLHSCCLHCLGVLLVLIFLWCQNIQVKAKSSYQVFNTQNQQMVRLNFGGTFFEISFWQCQ